MYRFPAVVVAVVMCMVAVEASSPFFPDPMPAYCNTEEDYSTLSIESLSGDELSQVASLKQVITMIRHGSRTPYAAGMACWEDYNIQWSNCNVTDLVLPSDALFNYSSQARPEPWLFRLVYDAWPDQLGGNCMTGQLMHEGYLQEQANGVALRAAYLEQTNANLNIFSTKTYSDLNTDLMYFRSDDEQRTIMSGQIMLGSFFDVDQPNVVTWHTMDDAIDQIAPNSKACPALTDAANFAYASANWTTFNNSDTITSLTSSLNDIWGEGDWNYYNCIDCMMTTVCTGRGIPPNPETGEEMTQEIFEAAVDQATYTYAFQAQYNSSWFSKLGMGRTVYNMRTHLEAAVNNDADAVKFALWSAHDTSIMPLLAALMGDEWDGQWARYAAMVTIELYEASAAGANDLFRLTYNGNALAMPGCGGATLCDVDVLLGLMAFAQEDMPCARTGSYTADDDTTDGSSSSSAEATLGGLTLDGWIGACAGTMALGLVIGGAVLYCVLNGGKASGSGGDNRGGNTIETKSMSNAAVGNPMQQQHAGGDRIPHYAA